MKKISITVVVLIVVAGAGWLFGKDLFQSDEKPDYTLVSVNLGSVVEKALAVGTIEPRQEITVKSIVPGIIARVFADVGDIVNPGDPLLEISPNPTPYEFAETRMAVEVADVDYKNTVRNHERQMALYRQDFIPEETVETSRYAMDQATLRLNLAKEKMELLQKGRLATAEQQVENIIRAWVKGTVLQRMVDVGDPVVPLTSYQEGTELMTIADMDQLIFKGTVDEIDVGKLKEGMPAILSIGALPGVELQGMISLIAPKAKVEENATLFDTEITLVPGSGVALRAGYSANANIIIQEKIDVLVIPERLVTFRSDSAFVEVEHNPHPEERAVTLGVSDGIQVEIVAGLHKDEQVVERPPKSVE